MIKSRRGRRYRSLPEPAARTPPCRRSLWVGLALVLSQHQQLLTLWGSIEVCCRAVQLYKRASSSRRTSKLVPANRPASNELIRRILARTGWERTVPSRYQYYNSRGRNGGLRDRTGVCPKLRPLLHRAFCGSKAHWLSTEGQCLKTRDTDSRNQKEQLQNA